MVREMESIAYSLAAVASSLRAFRLGGAFEGFVGEQQAHSDYDGGTIYSSNQYCYGIQ